MKTCTNVLIHIVGVTLLIATTAYISMSDEARRKVNNKAMNIIKSEKRMLNECCEDCYD